MGGLLCRCGIGLSTHDKKSCHFVLLEDDYWIVADAAGSNESMTDEEEDYIGDASFELWICPNCHRIWLGNRKDTTLIPYVPE